MARMTGGEAIVKALAREGVKVAFGLPGVQLYGIVTAFRDEPMRFITCRHEGLDLHGRRLRAGRRRHRRRAGRPRAGPAQRGGRSQHRVLRLVARPDDRRPDSAQSDRQEDRRAPRARRPARRHRRLDEVAPDASCRSPTRRASSTRPSDSFGAAARAPSRSTCRGTTMEEEADVTLLASGSASARGRAPAADIDRAAELLLARQAARDLRGRRRPSLRRSRGARRRRRAPAGRRRADRGGQGRDERRQRSLAGRRALAEEARCAAISTRPTSSSPSAAGCATARFQAEQQVIQIDADAEEIGRNHKKTVGLVGDAKATLEALLERLRAGGAPRRRARPSGRRPRRVAGAMTQEPHPSILKSLRAGTPDDAMVVAGMTQIGYFSRPVLAGLPPADVHHVVVLGQPRLRVSDGARRQGGQPAPAGRHHRGDGGFLYNAQEMATAVQHGINVVAVVFNDNAYGNVARDLDEHWGGKFRPSCTTPTSSASPRPTARSAGARRSRPRSASSSPTRSRWTGPC